MSAGPDPWHDAGMREFWRKHGLAIEAWVLGGLMLLGALGFIGWRMERAAAESATVDRAAEETERHAETPAPNPLDAYE